jgi:hypothetical protein
MMKTGMAIDCKGNYLRLLPKRKNLLSLLFLWGLLILAGCTTLEVRIEKTPTANQSTISTLAALMVEGTQNATLATQISLQPTPLPLSGIVSGQICYPSEHIPAMLAYFKDIQNNHLDQIQIMANQTTYQISLPPGEYVAYAWSPGYQVGGMYSKAVLCGLAEICTDHSPEAFSVVSGQITQAIDLCDWVIPPDQLPVPPGSQLPGP